jgi:uncharacterized UBP type Zn finger protein
MGGYNRHDTFSQQQNLSTNIPTTPVQNIMDRRSLSPTTSHRPVSQDNSQGYVDDEKVASLVSMDFDPAKAVAALKRHNNDLELALNELLAG